MDHQQKTSIRFYNDREVRAVWDEETSKSKKGNAQLVSATTQLKLKASDGKRYNTDVMDMESVRKLASSFPNTILITTSRRTNAMKHTYSTHSAPFCLLPGFGDPSLKVRWQTIPQTNNP